jgi:hypothetical protein
MKLRGDEILAEGLERIAPDELDGGLAVMPAVVADVDKGYVRLQHPGQRARGDHWKVRDATISPAAPQAATIRRSPTRMPVPSAVVKLIRSA